MLQELDIYQPGFTYTVALNASQSFSRLAHALVYNQLFNPFNCENMSDGLSVIITEHNLEKWSLRNLFHAALNHYDYNFYTEVNQITSCGQGLAILTLDELPDFVEHVSELVNQREVAVNELLAYIHKLTNQREGRDEQIERLPLEQRQQLEALALKADLKLSPRISGEAKEVLRKDQQSYAESLYELHEQATLVQQYLTSDATDYSFVYDYIGSHVPNAPASTQAPTSLPQGASADTLNQVLDQAASEQEPTASLDSTSLTATPTSLTAATQAPATQKTTPYEPVKRRVNFRTLPLGVVILSAGYLYNDPVYYSQRKHLLELVKAFLPSATVWVEQQRQASYTPLEDFSRYPLRNVAYQTYLYSPTAYFLQTGNVGQNNDRIHLEALTEYQDYRNFVARSGCTVNSQGTALRVSPGKNFHKLRDFSAPFVLALTFAQGQREVLFVVKDLAASQAQLEQAVALSPNLKGCLRYLRLVAKDALKYMLGSFELALVDIDVELERNDICMLSWLTKQLVEDHSPMIVYGAGDRKLKAKSTASVDYTGQQAQAVLDYLRDRRPSFRNKPAEQVDKPYIPCLSDNSVQAVDYFAHQEKRNWNSQLSGDKYLTVRTNNREISYYPNLSANQFVLAGFNSKFFDSPFDVRSYKGEENLVPLPFYQNFNLNSGDLITNISLAIHRIINLFSLRHLRLSKYEHLNVVWLCDHEELLPVYHKLFTNIFNKETQVDVKVWLASEITPETPTLLNQYSHKELNERKLRYLTALTFIKKFVPASLNMSKRNPAVETNFSLETPVDQLLEEVVKFWKGMEDHQLDQDRKPILQSIYTSFKQLDERLQQYAADGVLGQSNIYLATFKQFKELKLKEVVPDLLVVESCTDLQDPLRAADFANTLAEISAMHTPHSLMLISSPEPDAEYLLSQLERQRRNITRRPSLLNIALELPSAARYGYLVEFSNLDYDKLLQAGKLAPHSPEQATALAAKVGQQLPHLPFAALNTLTLPLSAYVQPTSPNPDYLVVGGSPVEAVNSRGYLPAVGEQEEQVQFPFVGISESTTVNTALSLIIAPKATKARGLLVVPETLVDYFSVLGGAFGFIVHSYESVRAERAIFSHAVIIAEEGMSPAVVSQAALLARGYKNIGSLFVLQAAQTNKAVWAALATVSHGRIESRLLNHRPHTIASKLASKSDFISPHLLNPQITRSATGMRQQGEYTLNTELASIYAKVAPVSIDKAKAKAKKKRK